MKLTITRSKWARGRASSLLSPNGTMCCLGFYCRALGLSEDQIYNKGTPPYLLINNYGPDTRWDDVFPKSAKWLFKGKGLTEADRAMNSDAANMLVKLNDHLGLKEDDRETRIAKIFADNGVEVEFVD